MIGVYCGSFDPVHQGHIALAIAALRAGLQHIVFITERQPRHKQQVTDSAHRLVMLELALKNHRHMSAVASIEPTLHIEQSLPQLVDTYGKDIAFIFGSDTFLGMDERSWPGLEHLLAHELIIGVRAGDSKESIQLHAIKIGARVRIVETAQQHVSSTIVRAASQTHKSLLDTKVQKYILQNGLYGL